MSHAGDHAAAPPNAHRLKRDGWRTSSTLRVSQHTLADVQAASSAEVPRWEETPLAQEVFLLNNLMQRVADRMVAHRGLTASRWLLMAALEHFDHPPTLTELSSDGLMTLQNVSRLVSEMERDGLVERFTVQGKGRCVFVRRTSKGEALCNEAIAEAEVFSRWLLTGVTGDERRAAERLLDRLIHNVLRLESALNERGVDAVLHGGDASDAMTNADDEANGAAR
jgi:DNA-binding MarR family transcriptional regulator